jgi:hypothetical protein
MLSEAVVSPMTGRFQLQNCVNFGFRSGSCINRTQQNLSERNIGFEMKLKPMNSDDFGNISEKDKKQQIFTTLVENKLSDNNNLETIKIEHGEAH